MKFLVPWGKYFTKAGGTVTGNLLVTGTIESQTQIIVTKDSLSPNDPHVLLRPATAAIGFLCVTMNDFAALLAGSIGGLTAGGIGLIHNTAGAIASPLDFPGLPGRMMVMPELTRLEPRRHWFMLNKIFGGGN